MSPVVITRKRDGSSLAMFHAIQRKSVGSRRSTWLTGQAAGR
ncbi:MAG: hypothetical protein P8K08_22200 [Fuerstiella sp.]|nr:hypothetical protein [Fuerstiella sp.]